MKKLLAITLGLSGALPAFCQSFPITSGSQWSGAGLMTIAKRPQFSVCIAPPGVQLPNFAGFKGLNLDGRALAGYNISGNSGTAGFALGFDKAINPNISLYVGGAYLYFTAGKPEPAICAQLTVKF